MEINEIIGSIGILLSFSMLWWFWYEDSKDIREKHKG